MQLTLTLLNNYNNKNAVITQSTHLQYDDNCTVQKSRRRWKRKSPQFSRSG